MMLKNFFKREFFNPVALCKSPELLPPLFHTYFYRVGKKLKLLSHPKNPFKDIQICSKDFNKIAYDLLGGGGKLTSYDGKIWIYRVHNNARCFTF